ncbi:uncharacterized protein LOC118561591 [Fundulus heteroclitus]|uniref:uncharacterized protein LOC118561591 n=1 Tax=Fundulus heteroclitus TaxID=8078 RepID=UPI00165BD1B0|nr:uncharacterized protein LOC118561591 [Fundulus heteroclitus]
MWMLPCLKALMTHWMKLMRRNWSPGQARGQQRQTRPNPDPPHWLCSRSSWNTSRSIGCTSRAPVEQRNTRRTKSPADHAFLGVPHRRANHAPELDVPPQHSENTPRWPDYLLNEGKAVTTIKSYLVNTSEFLAYFRDTPPSASRVPNASLVAVVRAISSSISKLGRRVVIRQIRIKKRKMSSAISRRDLHSCQVTARQRIPEILDQLSADPSPENRRRFHGYVSVYLASLYGHRTGVLKNMTVSEVDEAQQEARLGDGGFVH